MSAAMGTKWDARAYQRIASATARGDKLVVLFEDGTWVDVDRERVIRPGTVGLRWEEATATPYEVVVPKEGDPVEIPWSTIRALTDKEYSAYLAVAAEQEARHIGLRIKELRERRGLASKELAERAGITPQSLSRIEHGRHDVVFTTLQRLLAAMGYGLPDLVVAPQEPVSVVTVMRTLATAGLERDFVARRLLPRRLSERLRGRGDKADEESLAEQIAAAVGGVFGWPPAAILGHEPQALSLALPQGVRFKMAASANGTQAMAYTAYVHVLASIIHDATKALPVQKVPDDPDVLRGAVIERYGVFTFETLLRYTWDLGIPVIPLRDPGAFHGACWLMEGQPIIVLKQITDAQARWMFDLLHELKHVASHLNEQHPAYVEVEQISPYAPAGEEREASRSASAAILFGRAEELTQKCVDEAHGATQRLKQAVLRVAEAEHVPADALANYIAFRLARQNEPWWGTANNLQITDPAPWMIARDVLLEHIDMDRLDVQTRALLRRALTDDIED